MTLLIPSPDGGTRVCFVVGDPVAQLRTPAAMNELAQYEGANRLTLPAHVVAENLPSFLDGLRTLRNVAGAVMTIPHKQASAPLCDSLGPNAVVAGAVNAIRRERDGSLSGEIFDGLGFVAGLQSQGHEVVGARTVVLGAGGAASAVAAALAGAGARRVTVVNRTHDRAERLVAALRVGFPGVEVGVGSTADADADLVVNATSLGMSDSDPSPMRAADFPGQALAADVVMVGGLTPFLAMAHEQGARTHGGLHMLQGQLQLIADFIFAEVD